MTHEDVVQSEDLRKVVVEVARTSAEATLAQLAARKVSVREAAQVASSLSVAARNLGAMSEHMPDHELARNYEELLSKLHGELERRKDETSDEE